MIGERVKAARQKPNGLINPTVANIVLLICAVAWLFNLLADIFIKSYTFNDGINTIFLTIIGSTVTLKYVGGGKNGNGKVMPLNQEKGEVNGLG